MNFKRLISLVLCLSMLVAFALPLTSCFGGGNNGDNGDDPCTEHVDANGDKKCDKCEASMDEEGNTGETTTYTIKVTSVGKMPLKNVTVYIHNKDGYSICTTPKQTDANGTVKFDLPRSNDYSIELSNVPEGYSVKTGNTKADRYPMNGASTVIQLASAPITEGDMKTSYKVGDVMHDFTVTDVNGEKHTLSEILKTKDLVMINFWYIGCTWCHEEFPYLNTAYKEWGDDVEVLCVNDYGDNEASMREYASSNFPDDPLTMPMVKQEKTTNAINLNKFAEEGTGGYPTTVFIDRYGVICMVEIGALIGNSKWNKVIDHFVGDPIDYEQKIITDISQLTPPVKPDVEWQGSDEIASTLIKDGNEIDVTFSPETNDKDKEYSWPFITDTYGSDNIPCVRPSNSGKDLDGSYSIMYADFQLLPGQAIAFDYLSSTQRDSDMLYVIVDGKDIVSISGVDNNPKWQECCAYVDPRPANAPAEYKTYRLGLTYVKDGADSAGDDTVYLKDLRVIGVEDIKTATYIYRYAATEPNEYNSAFEHYEDVVLGKDGYYHVRTEDGPLLLVNHLGYTMFDSEQSVSQRMYAKYDETTGTLSPEDLAYFKTWEMFGTCAANSDIYGYTPVNEELKAILVKYCNDHIYETAKDPSDKLWLQLCSYYDAYGVDENGDPVQQIKDPILGLATFSAFKLEFTPEHTDDTTTYNVDYQKVVMPRGFLYEFIPTVSGVYRFTSKSTSEVVGWIYTGSSYDWATTTGDRLLFVDFETKERVCEELLITLPDGTTTFDITNTSLVAYMEAGTPYYIDFAFYDMYEFNSFDVEIKYEGTYKDDYFIFASPGALTYLETLDGGMGQLIALGIDYALNPDDGCMHHVIERDAKGNVTKWGSIIYADFSMPSSPYFTSQSIVQLNAIHAFNFAIDELDREALIHLQSIHNYGKSFIINEWVAEGMTKEAAEAKWSDGGYTEIIDDILTTPDEVGTYDADKLAVAERAVSEGKIELMKQFAIANDALNMSTSIWAQNNLYEVARNPDDPAHTNNQLDLYNAAKAEYDKQWAYYRIDDVANGVYHADPNQSLTEKDRKALEYLEILNTQGAEALEEQWLTDFGTIDLPDDYEGTQYEYLSDYYNMDDIKNGIYHGSTKDYTADVQKYIDRMYTDDEHVELKGCVAVTQELADMLDVFVSKYVFEDALHGWLKFCYYYQDLGTKPAN